MPKRIGYLGPQGTFSEEAALLYEPKGELLPFPSVPAVAAAVEAGLADEGVAAIENSIDGPVTDTLDLLIHESRLQICSEVVLPIEQHLLARRDTKPNEIRTIFSHPSALGQCRRFLERCFPQATLTAALSTSLAVELAMKHPTPAGAIGNRRAAEIFGAAIIARNIQDRPRNLTRFVVLSAKDHAPTGDDKTSVCFSFSADKPGQLFGVLQVFAERNVNLSKVESRPSKEDLGEYVFLIDFDGHRQEPAIAQLLDRVRAKVAILKVFGSYPKYRLDNNKA